MAPGYNAGATTGYNFKKITVVPAAKEFIDATLSKVCGFSRLSSVRAITRIWNTKIENEDENSC